MQLRDHLLALIVHGGILLAICIIVLTTSCGKEAPAQTPDAVAGYFRKLQSSLDSTGAESVVVIAVDDNAGAGQDLQRKVFQEIQAQLQNIKSASVLEYPRSVLDEKFRTLGIDPKDRISPEAAISLAKDLQADALLYASIESSAPDVHIKLYSGETGAVIFAETLQAWPLPVTKEEDTTGLEETGEGASSPDQAESSGSVSGSNLGQ